MSEILFELNTADFELKVRGPQTVEEYEAKGGEGSCLRDAVASVIYRSTVNEFWKAFFPKAHELTGIARGVNEKATEKARSENKDAKEVLEKPLTYARKLAAWASEDESIKAERTAALNALAQSVADTLYVDSSPGRRPSGPGKDALAKADEILGRTADGIENTVSKLLSAVPAFELERDEDGKPERESLAYLVKEYTKVAI